MNSIKDEFISLICDKSKTPEDIYNEMYQRHRELFSTKRIMRELKSWKNCIYQGTIGENDFIVSDASTTALDQNNTVMVYDDYKKTIIRFIEIFRQEYERDPNRNIFPLIISFSVEFLKEMFGGASRNGENIQSERSAASSFDEQMQMKKYNISHQRGKGKTAVCCERNVTIGNLFQFIGYETLQIAGYLDTKDGDDYINGEGHAFTLVKHGKGVGHYALFDLFNGVVIQKALPGDYDFTNGFKIEYYSERLGKTFVYGVDGPLHELNNEVLEVEAKIRNLSRRIDLFKYKYRNKQEIEEELNIERIKVEFEELLVTIENSNMSRELKDRYITRIKTFFLEEVNKIIKIVNNNYNNDSEYQGHK